MAAGRGTRMGALTDETPKPMLLILGKPKLEYSLSMLPDEVTEVILIVGYLGHQIRSYFGESFAGKKVRYVEQATLNGSGGAVHCVKDLVEEKFLVLNGDDLYDPADLKRLCASELAVLACELEDASQFGVLKTDSEGRLTGIIERPHAPELKTVNTGAYLLSKQFFDYPLVAISETEFGLPQTLVQVSDRYDIAVVTTKHWQSIGRPEDIPKGEEFLKKYR